MDGWWVVVVLVGGVLLLWAGSVVLLVRACRRDARRVDLRAAVRMVPDLVRLLRRLAADPELPRGVRFRLVALLVYLALPIDLVPDFIPVIGYADDVVMVAIVLRSVIRAAGAEAVERHWPGTEQGLHLVLRLAT